MCRNIARIPGFLFAGALGRLANALGNIADTLVYIADAVGNRIRKQKRKSEPENLLPARASSGQNTPK